MTFFEKYPSIEALRHKVKYIRNFCERPYPTLEFVGTVKLHGTNAAVCLHKDGSITYQSRNREITLENDNQGFCGFMQDKEDELRRIIYIPSNVDTVVIYGEFIGKGIQKGVGVSELEKTFVAFSQTRVTGNKLTHSYPFMSSSPDFNLYNIVDFSSFRIKIDFNNPEDSVEEIQSLVKQVEKECPVAKALGIPNGTGEGIVFTNFDFEETPFNFKAKGEKHSSSKVVSTTVSPDTYAQAEEFLQAVLTERRYEQGFEYLTEMGLEHSLKSTGPFIKWVSTDITKEESDLIEASPLEKKDLTRHLNRKVAKYYKNKMETTF